MSATFMEPSIFNLSSTMGSVGDPEGIQQRYLLQKSDVGGSDDCNAGFNYA